MAPKELAEFNRSLIGGCAEHDDAHAQTADLIETYLIPRTEPPTVEFFDKLVLYYHLGEGLHSPSMLFGCQARDNWQDGDRWLPLPKIEETTTPKEDKP